MEGVIRETLILHIEGDKVEDESGREVARVHQNKLVLGIEEHQLRLVIIQPKIKDIKNREQKDSAKEAVKKARIQIEFLDPHNDLIICPQVISDEIWNQKGVKRKYNSESDAFIADQADQLGSGAPSNPAELQSPTTHTSSQGVPVEAATPVLRKSVIKLTQSEVDEDAISSLNQAILPTVGIPQSPSPVYCLLDVYEDQNIIDRNMNWILNRIRLIKSGDIFETFGNGWSFDRRHFPEQNPQQLVLHRFGTPPSQESFKKLMEQVRRKELFGDIPHLHAATEREVMLQLQRCNLSRILSTNFLERVLSYNYVLIVGGKGPIVWRMW